MRFHEKLAMLMQESGVSNYKLAKALNCSQSSVKNWIDGNEPKLEYVSGIADFFGVSVDYLLGRTENVESRPNNTKKASDAEGIASEDEELIRLAEETLRKLRPEQKVLLIALMRTAIERNQVPSVSALGVGGGTIP